MKRLLPYTIAGALAASVYLGYLYLQKDANDRLQEIAELFEGDNSVTTRLCKVEGAQYGLIHILNYHNKNPLDQLLFSPQDIVQENAREMNSVQKSNYGVLSTLAKNGYKDVRDEIWVEKPTEEDIQSNYSSYLTVPSIAGLINLES